MDSRNAKVSSWPASPAREVWYGYVGDELRVLWYRYTLLSVENGREARLWAGYTEYDGPSRIISQGFGTGAVTTSNRPFSLDIAGNELTDGSAGGSLDEIDWDLTWMPDVVGFTPLRSRLLTGAVDRVSGTGYHESVNEAMRVDGTVTVDGEEHEFTNAAGNQGHTVSATPPTEWRWVQCGTFPDPTVSIEALSIDGRLSICFRHDGQVYLLNRVQHLVGPFANVTEYDRPGHWSFRAAGEGVQLSAMVRADPEQWQRVCYRTPDGKRYNAHCPLSTVRLKYSYDDQARTIESSGGRAEWVGTEPPIGGEYQGVEE
jgi:hypothetical protein